MRVGHAVIGFTEGEVGQQIATQNLIMSNVSNGGRTMRVLRYMPAS